MKLLVVQESDWLDVGVHDSHHIFERLSAEGWEITVIDYQIRNLGIKDAGAFSKRAEFNDVRKATPDGRIKVVRPAFIRMPFLNYLSIAITHFFEIRRQLKKNRPDAVIGMGIINTGILSAMAREYGIPFFYYMIDQLDELIPIKQARRLGKRIIRYSITNARSVMVTNHGLLTYALHLGAKPEETHVIGHGVDPSLYKGVEGNGVRNELGFREDDLVIFFMGWLYDFCGLDIVIDQMELSERKLKLLIIGKGEMAPLLRERASMNSNIILLDWKPFNELPKYIMASDVCVLPFINNEITSNIVPIKIFEYLAAGKPVLSTSLPGVVQEFGLDGPVHFMDHPREIISVLDKLINNKGQKLEMDKISEFVNEHSWENKVKKFKELVFDSEPPATAR